MRFFGACLFFILFTFTAHAQSDTESFNIRVFGGSDTEAPTTPVLNSATPIAPTQVDLDWTAATDNFTVSGYVVFRDSVAIATTTQITYSDAGVAASSTYSYFVRAFDLSFNYSSSSNILNVTTPDYPPPPPVASSTNPSQGTVARVVAEELTITPGITSTEMYIKTPHPARFEIRWGRTAAYELGYVATDIFQTQYHTVIADLEPGTVYTYQIIGYTPFGKQNIVKEGRFTTLSNIDLLPPANVMQFTTAGEGSDVRLSWKLPQDDDLSFVRIVRSHLGFPLHPADGAVVYQGLQTEIVDKNILSRYSPVYYTAFVFDGAGNVSSGAVSMVFADSVSGNEIEFVDDDGSAVPIGIGDGFSASTSVTFAGLLPELHEIYLIQGQRSYSFLDSEVALLSSESFVLTIPHDAVSKNIKSIIVTLRDPTDNRKNFSFLLRLNKQQTAYEAVIAPVGVIGESSITVQIYDFGASVVGTYNQQVSFIKDTLGNRLNTDVSEKESALFWQFLISSLVLLAIVLFWIVLRRNNEDKKR